MTPRALRWLAATSVGVGGFVLAWWVAEGLLNADRPTAVSAAAILALLLAMPLIRYASRVGAAEPSRPRRRSTLFTARHRKIVLPLVAVALVMAMVAGYHTWSPATGRFVSDRTATEPETPAPASSEISASAAPTPQASATSKPCTAKPATVAGQTRAANIPGRGGKVAVNHAGKQVAIATQEQTVVLYEVSSPGCPARASSVPAPANAGRLSFSPGRNLLAVSNYFGGRGTVTLYDTTSITSPRKVGSFEGGNSAFNANGRLMAYGAGSNTAVIYDVSDPASPARGATIAGSGTVVFSPVRDMIATTDIGGGGYGTAVNLYSIASPSSPTKLGTIAGGEQPSAVAFSANATLLAIATWQKTVTLWNIANPGAPTRVATLTGFAEMVTDLAFSPTRAILATLSIGTLNLWGVGDPASPSRIAQIPDNGSGLAFQPQGGFLVSSGESTNLYTF